MLTGNCKIGREGEGNRISVLEVVASSYHAKYNKNCRGEDGVYGGICLKNTVYLLTYPFKQMLTEGELGRK